MVTIISKDIGEVKDIFDDSNERKVCEICKSNRFLHVHHILPRSSHPELALDKDNLMVLCEECHKKIHSEDKYKYD